MPDHLQSRHNRAMLTQLKHALARTLDAITQTDFTGRGSIHIDSSNGTMQKITSQLDKRYIVTGYTKPDGPKLTT